MRNSGRTARAVLATLLVSAVLGVTACAERSPQLALNGTTTCGNEVSAYSDVAGCGGSDSSDDRATSAHVRAGVYYEP